MRQKEEIQSLRSETHALQTCLEMLKVQQACKMASQAALLEEEKRTIAADKNSSGGHKCWEVAAETEKQRRQIAEEENVRLKDKLKSYRKAFNTAKTVLDIVKVKHNKILMDKALVTTALQDELRSGHHGQFLSSVAFDLLENRANECGLST